MGGGLELSLACHFRISHAKAKIGLPEVKIGLIPGAGGTQRLPRLCHGGNVSWALNLILSGRMVGVDEAKTVGVIDHIVSNSDMLLDVAKKWASYAESIGDLTYRTACYKNVLADDDADGRIAARKICDDILKKLPKVVDVINTHDFVYEITFSIEEDMRSYVFDFAQDNDLKILRLNQKNASLESLFRELTS